MVFLSVTRPSHAKARAVAEDAQKSGFNYKNVGATSTSPDLPDAILKEGWAIDHARVKVGSGKEAFHKAKQLVSSWGHFQLGWADVEPSTPVKEGAPVCVRANTFGVWSLNPLQIVYAKCDSYSVEDKQPGASKASRRQVERFAFAHGCLSGHLLAGEERFSVEWDRADGSVWYEIHTFSKPGHPLALLGYPLVRLMQKRFAHDSTRLVARQLAEQQAEQAQPGGQK